LLISISENREFYKLRDWSGENLAEALGALACSCRLDVKMNRPWRVDPGDAIELTVTSHVSRS
jgi:hypothetical protein